MSQFARAGFGIFLKSAHTLPRVNRQTVRVVRVMNSEMERNGVPMSEEHQKVAQDSITSGDDLCAFLVKENPHVLKSTGSGWAYQSGYMFHKYIVAIKVDSVKAEDE